MSRKRRKPRNHRKYKDSSGSTPSGEGFAPRGRVWIDGPLGTFMGYGRVVLMERIRQYGSITQAARSMNMSYRRAWVLIDSMNRQAPEPFVQTSTGGKGGGGTRLTGHGERAVELFWKFYGDFQEFLRRQKETIRFDEGD